MLAASVCLARDLKNAHLHRSLRFVGVQATSAYRIEALDALRAMGRLRGRESEACDACVSRARLAAVAARGAEGHVCGHAGVRDGVGMVKR